MGSRRLQAGLTSADSVTRAGAFQTQKQSDLQVFSYSLYTLNSLFRSETLGAPQRVGGVKP